MNTIRRDLMQAKQNVKRRVGGKTKIEESRREANALFAQFEAEYQKRKESFMKELERPPTFRGKTEQTIAAQVMGISNVQIIHRAINSGEVFTLATRTTDMIEAIRDIKTNYSADAPPTTHIGSIDPQLTEIFQVLGMELSIVNKSPPPSSGKAKRTSRSRSQGVARIVIVPKSEKRPAPSSPASNNNNDQDDADDESATSDAN